MQSTQITRYTNLPCHARDIAEAEFMSKVIPEWSSFSNILRREYELVGSPIDWSVVKATHLPPVENHVISSGEYKRHLTSLQETYIMKPVTNNRSFDRYFTVYFYVVVHQHNASSPKNYSPAYGFKVGKTLSELNELHRSIEQPVYTSSYPSTAQAIKTGRQKITLTQDLVSLSYESDDSPNSYNSDMWFSGTGDPITGMRNTTIIGSTMIGSGGGAAWSVGADSYGRVFDDTVSSTGISGGKGVRYGVARAILPNGTVSSDLNLKMLNTENSAGTVLKNLEGTETIIPGPYYYGGNIIHSNAFYGTPFFFTYNSEASPGSRQIIDGITYFGSSTMMYGPSAGQRKFYQPMVREFPI